MSQKLQLKFGVAYYGDHWPEEQWDRDLSHIASLGIELVRFGEFSWAWFEPQPGKFDFRAYERFLALAARKNLKLVLCTPTATPPPWFIRRFPDGRLMDAQGLVCTRPRHFWCWHHAESRKLAEKTIRALVERFAGHEAVVGWQIDNEPNYSESEIIYDYNPHALAAFRRWLKQRHHDSLDSLNRAWYTAFWSQTYGDWDEIGTLPFHATNPNAWLDFARFREAHLAEFVRWQASLIRGIDSKVAVGTNIPETGVRLSALIGQDYFDQARGLDWIGTDLYYATGNRAADLQNMRYSTDLMRSAAGKATFVISETQAGPHQRTWPQGFAGEAWSETYLEQSVQAYVEHGAAGVWFFLFRPTPGGVELGMNGLTAPDGGPSPRTRKVEKLATQWPSMLARFKQREKRRLAVIHYSRDSIRFLTFWRESLDRLEQSYRGWHRLLDVSGYRVRFVGDDELAAGELPPEMKLLVLPQSHVLNDTQLQKLLQLARTTRLILGPHTALLDHNGQLRQSLPGGGLTQLAGVTPGLLHDTRINGQLGTINGPAIDAIRAADVSTGKVYRIVRFANPRKLAAVVTRARVTWTGFDVGRAHQLTSDAGRRYLARLLAVSG